jgi:hypothetical protein
MKANKKGVWQKRWFVLVGGFLDYYKSPDVCLCRERGLSCGSERLFVAHCLCVCPVSRLCPKAVWI